VDEDRARDLLGLDPGADVDAVKRAFRTLAHDLHPDRGGDPRAFQDLHVAYRLLVASFAVPARPPAPRVARGRPSRIERAAPQRPATATGSGPLVGLTAEERSALASPRAAPLALDQHLLARLLVDGGFQLASRAPGSRINRFATMLDTGSTSTVLAVPTRVELTARSRAARRAVTALDVSSVVGVTWSRRRGDALTVLSASFPVGPQSQSSPAPGGAAPLRDAHLRATVDAVIDLLDALAWPLRAWRLDTGRP